MSPTVIWIVILQNSNPYVQVGREERVSFVVPARQEKKVGRNRRTSLVVLMFRGSVIIESNNRKL